MSHTTFAAEHIQDNPKVLEWRSRFPALQQEVHGHPLIYLDNAATTLKPQVVIDRVNAYYAQGTANIHRGVHFLSEQATLAYEQARKKVQKFIGAQHPEEIIFTRGTTESINLVAYSYARTFLKAGDVVVISAMEHHSNIVPWQILCDQIGSVLKVIPMNHEGELQLDAAKKLFTDKTKLLSVVGISNSLGTVNPLKELIAMARSVGAKVLVDGAQMVSHQKVDVSTLDCDFFAFSGHKLFGPTGIGVLYGKKEILNKMPPFLGGGDMIETVTFEKTTYAPLPHKFEAGTPHIAGVLGLAAAIDFVESIGLNHIWKQEQALLQAAQEILGEIPGLKFIGTAKNKASVVSFVMENVHPHDIGTLSDHKGIALRTGQHCTAPVMDFFGISSTARASFSFYNTLQEVETLGQVIRQIGEMFK